MADLKKVADDLTSKAALEAGKDAARRAVEDLLSTDEEKAQREAEREAASKNRRNKFIAYGVVALLLVIGILGFVANYWQWFFFAGLLGLGGMYGYYRFRKRFGKKDDDGEETEQKATMRIAEEDEVAAAPPEKTAEERAAEAAKLRAEREREALARREAEALEEQQIDDELAAMKARLDK